MAIKSNPVGALTDPCRLTRLDFDPDQWEELDDEIKDCVWENSPELYQDVSRYADLIVDLTDNSQADEVDLHYEEERLHEYLGDSYPGDHVSDEQREELLHALRKYYPRAHTSELERVIEDAIEGCPHCFRLEESRHDEGGWEVMVPLFIEPPDWIDEVPWGQRESLVRDALRMAVERGHNAIVLSEERFVKTIANGRAYEVPDWGFENFDIVADEYALLERAKEIAEDEGLGESSKKRKSLKDQDAEVIYTFNDGFYVVRLRPEHLRAEGRALGHCVGHPRYGYAKGLAEGRFEIWSLRTPGGKPKLTIQVIPDEGRALQVYGYGDRPPGYDRGGRGPVKEDEVRKVIELFDHFGIDPWTATSMHCALEELDIPRRSRRSRTNNPSARGFCQPSPE